MFYIYGAEQGAGYAYGCLRDCISGIFAAGSDGFSVRQTEKKKILEKKKKKNLKNKKKKSINTKK